MLNLTPEALAQLRRGEPVELRIPAKVLAEFDATAHPGYDP